jgi:hypothetical protein
MRLTLVLWFLFALFYLCRIIAYIQSKSDSELWKKSLLTTKMLPNQTTSAYQYDSLGQLTQLKPPTSAAKYWNS